MSKRFLTPIESNVPNGTAPLIVTSSAAVTNLNADLLDGQHGTYYAPIASPTFTGTVSIPQLNVTTSASVSSDNTYWALTLNNSQSDGGTNLWKISPTGSSWTAGDNKLVFTYDGVSSSSAIVTLDGPNKRVGINTASPSSTLQVVNSSSATVAEIIQGAASQSANLTEWRNSAGTILVSISSSGVINLNAANVTDALNLNNNNIIGINTLSFSDPGPNEGITWTGGNGWYIYESPDDLTTNTAGNLQIAQSGTRRATFRTDGVLDTPGGLTTAGQIISTRANNTASGGAQIYLNGATGNRIDFNQNGVAVPSTTTRSAGTKIVLYPDLSATNTDYAIGVSSYTLWNSVSTASGYFRWYAGTTNIATLSGTGAFSAVTKSFDIPHPTKENMRLRYGSLEGPENGVYVRGKSNSRVIVLPDYWTGLVDEDSITVHITPVGSHKNLYVKNISNNQVTIGGGMGKIEFFYFIQAERKDTEKLVVEYVG